LVIYIIEQETDGIIVAVFVPSIVKPYRINANFDTLSASRMADYSGPNKVVGNIFSQQLYDNS
jgi:hypothetical protein